MPDPRVREIVRGIIAEVRTGGADAVRTINARVGGGLPDGRLLLGPTELAQALDALDPDLRRAIATKWPGNRLLVTSLGQPAARRCDLVGVWARQPEVNGLRLRLRGSHPIG